MEKILKSYLRRLSNLSGNNRSLLLLRLLKEQFIDIHDFNFINTEASFSIIKKLIEQEKHIFLCSDIDDRDKFTNELGRRLKKIQYIEKFIYEERGAKDLYIGWPFVKGKFSDETVVRAPLIFFPVSIEKQGNEWYLSRRLGVNITLNKTFLLAYAYYNGVKVDEELIETVIDGTNHDATSFRTELYELLKRGGVEINFNQENFADELKSFATINRLQLESTEKTGVLKLHPNAVLGIFPQAGSYLVPDYIKLMEDDKFSDLEKFFEQKIKKENEIQLALFDRVNEENTFTPFLLDAYQEYALKEIKKGNSLVVQGPPGTGKSQLISNLICDFIARGKNVLLVCQKKAALDVVYQRLKEKEIHDFVALVHDFKNDRKSIFKQIDSQIESIDMYQKKNNSIDAIQLERNFLQTCRRIDQIIEELKEFKEALFDEKECGKSVKELYLMSSADQANFSMNFEYQTFHFSTLEETETKFKNYLTYFDRFEKRTHFWAKGPSFDSFETKDIIELKKVLYEIPIFNENLLIHSKKLVSKSIDFETAEYLSNKLPELLELQEGLKEESLFKVFKQLHENKPTKSLNWLSSVERKIMTCFRGREIEKSLKTKDIGKLQEVLQRAMSVRKNPFSWIYWNLVSKEKSFLKRVLVANTLKNNKQGFDVLLERIDNRLNFEHLLSLIKKNKWLHNFPDSFRKIDLQDWFYWQKMGLNMFIIAQKIRTINEYLPVNKLTHQTYLSRLEKFINYLYQILHQLALWSRYLNIHQIRAIILKKENIRKLENLLKKDFDALCVYHKLKKELSKEERVTLNKISEQNTESIDVGIKIFKNSLALAWIDNIESKYPSLRHVTSGILDNLTEELREKIEMKRKASKEILLLKLREKTYENTEYNRLKNRITYRDLKHQVSKRRRIWPIRKVVAEFSEELYTLLPCWMCSPESASAIFPMEECFDLVIFDEASQCFAERGLPAMYRGKQLVVTGDSMQLQPSDLYRTRWEEEDDDLPALHIDSLLNLTKYYLPEVTLSGHYRSKSLELIDFSNEHFYKGKLQLLPDYYYVNKKKSAIDYIETKGVWGDGVNKIEANLVVETTLKILKEETKKDIGIVTFNFKQQRLIFDLLEEKSLEEDILLPASLFVKNIENVQGDERDIIIFSIGYAADKKGKVKLQFGSLNIEGGENRLNVAVTRAKEKIIVITSIRPELLKIENLKNKGPKILKKYLEYAIAVSTGKWKPYITSYEKRSVAWYLRDRLSEKTFHEQKLFKLTKELPFADLSIKKRNTYLGLILTDDESYYEALSPKQIYAFQHFHLQMKNWPHIRFHSREFWLDPKITKERIKKFLFSH